MTTLNEYLKLRFLLIISFIFVVITNNYFSYEESIVFGARDGADYFLIAQNFPNISHDALAHHKAWRFIIPMLIV